MNLGVQMSKSLATVAILTGIAVVSIAVSLNRTANQINQLRRNQAMSLDLISQYEQLKNDYMNAQGRFVVKLTNKEFNHGGTGSFVTTPSGRVVILTNNHICDIAEDGDIYVNEKFRAHILAQYPKHDLCALSAPGINEGLNIAERSRLGQIIHVVGHPYLQPTTVTNGEIAGYTITKIIVDDPKCEGEGFQKQDVSNTLFGALFNIQFICIRSLPAQYVTANILPGNSGSPVLDDSGDVVGVAYAGIEGSASGFIVPLVFVQDFLKDL